MQFESRDTNPSIFQTSSCLLVIHDTCRPRYYCNYNIGCLAPRHNDTTGWGAGLASGSVLVVSLPNTWMDTISLRFSDLILYQFLLY
ncbi:hypothetical protein CY34DRAFT_807314 [Suillus luteus UH-Slu-Lm8-n1]|uniref:Uncharacterized protein n=1 Tax=Suillus luteus UH-Slu-Lm8-n1 TaxID=930992 RepID=A0A0D0AF96_9AGAM|nr:hypothetical protein CY34DRAFT_807314 [Suillus luteus UH-Slu-Lm8-n1]